MTDPLDRIYHLKHEAARQGLMLQGTVANPQPFYMVAGGDFIASLLMHPHLRDTSMSSLASDSLKVFGVPITRGGAPDGLKLVFELDG